MGKRAAILFAALIALACGERDAGGPRAGGPQPPVPPATAGEIAAADRADIAEAAFRRLFDLFDRGDAGRARPASFFLSIEGRDPDDAFLSRFEGSSIPIRKGSAFREGAGIRLEVDRPAPDAGGEMRVEASYHEAGESAGGYRLRLERRGGAWAVVELVRVWIS